MMLGMKAHLRIVVQGELRLVDMLPPLWKVQPLLRQHRRQLLPC
jgi:hypothetical protein